MGGCRPLDDFLSHVPDLEEWRIVRTSPGIEKREADYSPEIISRYTTADLNTVRGVMALLEDTAGGQK